MRWYINQPRHRQHVDVLTCDDAIYIITLLDEYSVLTGQTTAIFKPHLHFYLSYTPKLKFRDRILHSCDAIG